MNMKSAFSPKTMSPWAQCFIGWIILLTLIPTILIFLMSLLNTKSYGVISWQPTLLNYARLFDWTYLNLFLKTIALSLGATLTCLLVGFPVAYYLARVSGWKRTLGLILLFIPFWTNFILRIHAVIALVGNSGLINQALLGLGLIDQPIELLYTRTGVFIGLAYNYLPFLVIPLFSSLEKFDLTLREAALDLGANRIQTFWLVLLPNIRHGLIIGSLFVFIPMMGEYVIPDLLGGGKDMYLGNLMVNQFFVMQDWPFGAAIASVLSVGLIFALVIQYRWESKTDG